MQSCQALVSKLAIYLCIVTSSCPYFPYSSIVCTLIEQSLQGSHTPLPTCQKQKNVIMYLARNAEERRL